MNNKEKNFVSAVIYVYNAEKQIEAFLRMIAQTLDENFEHSEIICVNDCSDDNSVEKIRQVSQSVSKVSISVVNMSYFHGLEAAMNAGVDLSIGDFVFEFDHTQVCFTAAEIMQIYRRSLEGFDIVSASPEGGQRFSSKLFYFMFDKFTNLSYKMYTESFRVLSRRVINRISSMNKSVPYRKAVYANCGLKTDIMTYQPAQKEHMFENKGNKKETKYRRRLAVDTLILFTEVGYRFSIVMTCMMILATLLMGIYSSVTYIVSVPKEGWTTTILFLSFAFFGLFAILTVIIKYLQIIVDLVFKRKRYSFEGIEKMTK